MNSSLVLPIPAFSLGSYGSLAAHSAFWLGLLSVLFVSGMVFARLYGAILSAWIESRGMWWWKFAVSGSIRRFLKISMTAAKVWTAKEEAANVKRLLQEAPGRTIKERLMARLWTILCLVFIAWVAASGYIKPFWYPIEHRENVYVIKR